MATRKVRNLPISNTAAANARLVGLRDPEGTNEVVTFPLAAIAAQIEALNVDMPRPGGGGGGGESLGPVPMRFITSGTLESGVTWYPVVEDDHNKGVVAPFSVDPHVVVLPTTAAPIGTTLTVVYGDPVAPLVSPPVGTPSPLVLGYLGDPYATHVSAAIEDGNLVSVRYGHSVTIAKTNELVLGPQTFHIWVVVAGSKGYGLSGGGGGVLLGPAPVVRWSEAGYSDPAAGLYNDFATAVAALTAVGGGTLEVRSGGISGVHQVYNIDLVGVEDGFTTKFTFRDDASLEGLRSAKDITFEQDLPTSSACIQASTRLELINCDVGNMYAATVPYIAAGQYLVLRGNTRLGAASVYTGSATTVFAHDASVAGADTFYTAGLGVTLYGNSFVSEDQPNVTGAFYRQQAAMQRVIAREMTSGYPPYWANSFIESDTSGGNTTITAYPYTGLDVTIVGTRAWVAKRNNGGDVTIDGLTYVPGGGTSYTITEENAVVELFWLPGGVQVKP